MNYPLDICSAGTFAMSREKFSENYPLDICFAGRVARYQERLTVNYLLDICTAGTVARSRESFVKRIIGLLFLLLALLPDPGKEFF